MRLYAAGWLLLLIFSDSGMVKHMGDYDSQKDCEAAWNESKQCFRKMAEREKAKGGGCLTYCGQPIGFCIEAERLNMPGIVFPVPKTEAPCD